MSGLNYERRMMAQRNAALTKEVEALRPKVKDLEWQISLHEAALNAAGKANEQLLVRADLAAERERELVEALKKTLAFARALERHSSQGAGGRRGGHIFAQAERALASHEHNEGES